MKSLGHPRSINKNTSAPFPSPLRSSMISSGRGPFGRPGFIESAKLVLSEPAKKQPKTCGKLLDIS